MTGSAELLIVGGGLHAVHLAVSLVRRHVLPPSAICIVDPSPRLMHQFFSRAARVEMTHLRSSAVHHLDVPYDALWAYGKALGVEQTAFAPPYALPPIALFEAHCRELIDEVGLEASHRRARVVDLQRLGFGWEAALVDGERLTAERVVLALGQPTAAAPTWARAPGVAPLVRHVLDVETPLPAAERIAVVGGGITAAQHALALSERAQVTLLMRSPPDIQRFDADPLWMGPKGARRLAAAADAVARRALIDDARRPGSLPPELYKALQRAAREGRLQLRYDRVVGASSSQGALTLALRRTGELVVDAAHLAIGLQGRPEANPLVAGLVASGLPVAACGAPLLSASLAWAPELYVTGGLAELTVGPVAANIAGARLAAERILSDFEAQTPVDVTSTPDQGERHDDVRTAA